MVHALPVFDIFHGRFGQKDAVWLGAALLLPVYMLFKAMFRRGRRTAARMEQARFARFARGY